MKLLQELKMIKEDSVKKMVVRGVPFEYNTTPDGYVYIWYQANGRKRKGHISGKNISQSRLQNEFHKALQKKIE
jgi:hypothetical protein